MFNVAEEVVGVAVEEGHMGESRDETEQSFAILSWEKQCCSAIFIACFSNKGSFAFLASHNFIVKVFFIRIYGPKILVYRYLFRPIFYVQSVLFIRI